MDNNFNNGNNQQAYGQSQYQQAQYNQGFQQQPYGQQPYGGGPMIPNPGIEPRDIVMCIILSIVTCGIYGIYWMIKLNDEVNVLSREPVPTSGGTVFLLCIVTCGIYTLYWYYKTGEKVDRIKGIPNGSSNILFLVLGLLGVGALINYCLIQDTINKAVGGR